MKLLQDFSRAGEAVNELFHFQIFKSTNFQIIYA